MLSVDSVVLDSNIKLLYIYVFVISSLYFQKRSLFFLCASWAAQVVPDS